MKLDTPINSNYVATVVEVKTVVPLANCDNLVGLPFFGMQAIVSKETKVGAIGLLFPAECQLSEEYVSYNNLYRHSDYNRDKTQSGYLEDNRRVRAIRLRKHESSALFMPLSSLEYLSSDIINQLRVGDIFDRLDGHEICRKYTIPVKHGEKRDRPAGQKKAEARVDPKFFPLHPDTEQWLRNVDSIAPDTSIIVSQKLHGTSIRVAHTLVNRRLSWLERLAKRFGVRVQEREWAMVYGSRKVTKDANNPNQQDYYSEDLWSKYGHTLDDVLPKGYFVFGEIIGYTSDGAAIQKNYTYDCQPGESKLYVYRVAHINEDGLLCDLSWDQMIEFCQKTGLLTVPEIWRGKAADFDAMRYMNLRYAELVENSKMPPGDFSQCVPLAKESPCDEGVVIRIDGLMPKAYKAKSALFLEHETRQLDGGESDLESQQDVEA